ncbi:MAG: GIY-YIG nuclease family protein [Candidatus Methanomethyliaceae archaeon]|nr:GIY-YIG nuclease family protein [Candidatus Methanomethyliaceae archaeon]
MKGSYAIILRLNRHSKLEIGKNQFNLNPGVYIYAGSAFGPGGIVARLRRHLKTFTTGTTKKHWHIDSFLRLSTAFISVYASSPQKMECGIVRSLKEMGFKTVRGFGNTDCRSGCGGHLVFMGDLDLQSATQRVIAAFEKIGLEATLETRAFKDYNYK